MSRMVDRCPSCDADALALHHDFDGDETGVWPIHWFACGRCGREVSAENCAGEHVPVVDEEDECGTS
jgi:ribosomal protein S27AE